MANNLAAFNSEAWALLLVQKLDQINVMLPLCNRNWEGDLTQNKTVHIRTPGNIAMSPYTRGTQISYEDLTPTDEQFTVNDGEYFAFNVDDIDKAQSDINAMSVYSQRALVAMNNTVEAKILSAHQYADVTVGAASGGSGAVLVPVISGGQVTGVTVQNGGTNYPATGLVLQFVGGTGNGAEATVTVTSGAITAVTMTNNGNNYTIAPKCLLTTASPINLTVNTGNVTDLYQVFTTCGAIHSTANVPATPGWRWAVIDPFSAELLLQDTQHFVRAGDLGDMVVQSGVIGGEEVQRRAAEAPGFIGMVAGYMVYSTPHVATSTDGTQKYLLFGDNESISYAAQITEIEALRLQNTFANAIRGLMLHDVFVPAESSKRLIRVAASNATLGF